MNGSAIILPPNSPGSTNIVARARGWGWLLVLFAVPGFAQTPLTLHYEHPAGTWTEALPIGNGRLGAMVFGGVNQELIRLNEATLWSGGPVGENANPGAFDFLAPARAALARGEFGRAADLVKNMQGHYTQSYLPLGDLLLEQSTGAGNISGYRRDLNLRSGMATTVFTADGVHYRREVFVSAPDEVIVLRFSADAPHKISLSARTKSQLRASAASAAGDQNTLTLHGRAPTQVDPSYFNANHESVVYDHVDACKGMRFELSVRPQIVDGTMEILDGELAVERATEVVLLITAATSFNGFDQCPFSHGRDEHALNAGYLAAASRRSYTQLLARHVADFSGYFDRVALRLNPGEADLSERPTDQRLEFYAQGGADSNLEALYFQYGRYLLISSSRTPNVPANLQGIWNQDLRPAWSSNYTININLQMNYWPADSANLSELFAPLDGFLHNLAVNGAKTASHYYHAPGWVAHHNSDLWAQSDPVGDLGKGDPMWANWYMGANWLSRHLWEHYQFTGDREFLSRAYPLMKGAAEFTLAWLQKDSQGYLVTSPSTSPENVFFYEHDGERKQGAVSVASTMDMGIIRDLFANVRAAGTALDIDPAFRERLAAAERQLFPFQFGAKGQLQEWYRDFEDVDPHHRHASHLYALYPAHEISPLATPALAAAAKKTLELRGDEGTGWSLAWKVNLWARLLDGNHAYQLFRRLLRLTKENDTRYDGHGGAYPNLLDAHPPFQIDGNFGGTAGVIEMLLQSQNQELHLLPALPDAWAAGSISGLIGRGGYRVDLVWADHRLVSATILAREGGECVIRTAQPVRIKSLGLTSKPAAIGYTLRFNAERGRRYQVSRMG